MTEEVKDLPEGQTPDPVATPEVDPIEQKALEMGWRPKDDFNGDEAEFIDAKEFVRRAPLFEKIEHQGKQLKSAIKALEAFKDHYSKVKETEYNRALSELKAARKAASREGDFERAEQYEEHIERIESEAAEFKQEQQQIRVDEPAQQNPQFVSWKNRNPWYENTPHMRVFADEYGIKLARAGEAPDKVLKLVEEAVKKEFPNKFRNPNRDSDSSVESPNRSGRPPKDDFEASLNDQERQVMRTLTSGSNPTMTKAQYLADLKAIKGVK